MEYKMSGKFDAIKELAKGKGLTENRETSKEKDKRIKPKLIPLPKEWEDLIKTKHYGTLSSYILSAIKEKMMRENLL